MPDSDPDTTGQRTLNERLHDLEKASDEGRDHRTKINTILALIGVVLSVTIGGLTSGAITTRDTVLSNTSRLGVVEQRVAAVDARDQRRDDSERTSREQLVEIRADVRALREQLDTLTRALAGRDDHTPRTR